MAVAEPDDHPAVPRPVLVIVGLAGVFIVVAGLRSLSDLIGPVFLALVLTVAAHPIRPWAQRRGLPGWVGTTLAIVVIYAVLIALAISLLVAGARFATILPTYQDKFTQTMQDAAGWLKSAGVGQQQIDDLTGSLSLNNILDGVGGLVTGLLGVLSSVFLLLLLVIFMVVDASGFTTRLEQLPPERQMLVSAFSSFARSTRKYLIVSTVFGLIVAAMDTVALWWIGVPVALVWGLLAFITNYIPNVGFVIGLVPPAVLGLLEGGVGMMIAVIVVYCLINLVIQSVIQPKIVGEAVGLSATITMVSLVFWAATLGAVGALMAVPLSLLARAMLVDADPRSAWIGSLLTGGVPEPQEEPQQDDELALA